MQKSQGEFETNVTHVLNGDGTEENPGLCTRVALLGQCVRQMKAERRKWTVVSWVLNGVSFLGIAAAIFASGRFWANLEHRYAAQDKQQEAIVAIGEDLQDMVNDLNYIRGALENAPATRPHYNAARSTPGASSPKTLKSAASLKALRGTK